VSSGIQVGCYVVSNYNTETFKYGLPALRWRLANIRGLEL